MPIVNDDGVHETEFDSVAFTLPPELKRVYITKDDPEVKQGTDPGDDKMVVTPNEVTRGQELDRYETDPTTGTGLEVQYNLDDRRNDPNPSAVEWKNVLPSLKNLALGAGAGLGIPGMDTPMAPERPITKLGVEAGLDDIKIEKQVPTHSLLDRAIDDLLQGGQLTSDIYTAITGKPRKQITSDTPFSQVPFSKGVLNKDAPIGRSELARQLEDFKARAAEPVKLPKDMTKEEMDQSIETAINVGMGAGPGIIAGEKSLTAPARALGKAMSMSGFKDSPEAIRKATGWFKGTDGKWKYEISDEGMKLADRDWKYGETGKLKDFIEHPELFKAYPEIGEINFKVAEKGERYLGSFDSRTKTLMINPEKIPAGEEGLLDTIVHELQHIVQRKEGFAYGSNPKAALEDVVTSLVQKMKETKDPEAKREMMELFLDIHNNVQKFAQYMYLRVPGEVEANIVATRRKLPDNLRKEFSVEEHQRMVEGEKNTLHGGNYVPEFIYPK